LSPFLSFPSAGEGPGGKKKREKKQRDRTPARFLLAFPSSAKASRRGGEEKRKRVGREENATHFCSTPLSAPEKGKKGNGEKGGQGDPAAFFFSSDVTGTTRKGGNGKRRGRGEGNDRRLRQAPPPLSGKRKKKKVREGRGYKFVSPLICPSLLERGGKRGKLKRKGGNRRLRRRLAPLSNEE